MLGVKLALCLILNRGLNAHIRYSQSPTFTVVGPLLYSTLQGRGYNSPVPSLSQEAANTITSGIDEDDGAELEAQGLLKEASFGGGSHQVSLSSAQRSLLQALEVQLQVQQYAEATLAAMRSQERLQLLGAAVEPPARLPLPANLGSLLRSQSARLPQQQQPPSAPRSSSNLQGNSGGSPAKQPTPPGARKGSKKGGGGGDDMIGVMRAFQRQATCSRGASSPSDAYPEEVSNEARRAAGIVRAASTRQRVHDGRE